MIEIGLKIKDTSKDKTKQFLRSIVEKATEIGIEFESDIQCRMVLMEVRENVGEIENDGC